jgi:hypothetical protein
MCRILVFKKCSRENKRNNHTAADIMGGMVDK